VGYDEHEQVKPHLYYRVYSFSCRLSSDYATADQVSGMGGKDQCLQEIITFALPSSCFASLVPALHPSQDMPCTSGMQVLYLLSCSIECCLQKGSWLQLIVCEVVWPLKSQCSINSATIV